MYFSCLFPDTLQAYFMYMSSSILVFRQVYIHSFFPFVLPHVSVHMHTFMASHFLILDSLLQHIVDFRHFRPFPPSVFPHSVEELLNPFFATSPPTCMFPFMCDPLSLIRVAFMKMVGSLFTGTWTTYQWLFH